jgi:cobalt-zinc-cadmium resistance protein CzcA
MAQTSISLDSWSMNASNRLATACLQGVTPTLGPISTGLGEIYLWTVEAEDGAKKADGTPYTPMDLREIQDWVIKPQLRMCLASPRSTRSVVSPRNTWFHRGLSN